VDVKIGKLPKAKLSIEVPEQAWVREVSKSHPDAVFRVISAFAGDDHGVGIVEVEPGKEENIADIVRDMSEHEVVEEIDILWTDEEDALVQFRTRRPMMLMAARKSKVPVRMPFEIQDGTGTWELTASRERLSDLSNVFESMGISYQLEYLHEIRSEDFLTEKQQETMRAALDMGYYDTPREASLSKVAEECGIAKSTCSEILHRAEERIIKDFFR